MSAYMIGLCLWAGFLASWYLAYAWIAKAVTGAPVARRVQETAYYAVSFGLLFAQHPGAHPLWSTLPFVAWGWLGLELVGFAFAWWARLHLGRLWSVSITLREGHRVVESGPYGLVRHPIYTGFILAAWAFALMAASPTALLGAAALTATMHWKARREEVFLRQTLGAAAYDDYAARTPMLIPVLRAGRGR